jgi:simple sugar transport system ATP-binding protein
MAQLPPALSSESAPPAGGAAPVPLCELQEVSVSYGTRLANDGVSLRLQPGEVVALLGENGAGKSTLLHALYGLVGVSGGQVRYRGAAVVPSPERAIAAGIGLIHQHFLLVPRLTVAENVVLGSEPRRLGVLLDRRRAVAQTAALAARYGLPVDPERPVTDLSVGESQRVELLKILYRGARCLLLDEPTAVLTPGEAQRLLAVLRELLVDRPSAPGITQPPAGAARLPAGATAEATRSPAGAAAGEGGSALLIVTHKLDEVLQVADRAVVMRRGRVVAQLRRSEFSAGELARAMVGRELHPLIRQPAAPAVPGVTAAAPALELTDVRVVCEGVERVRGVSLRLAAGTILGIAGVEGNGQSELGAAIAGLLPLSHGQVRLGGQDVTAASVRARKRAGLGFVLEDRQRHGLVLDFSLAENLLLGSERAAGPFAGLLIDQKRLQRDALALLREHDIRPPEPTLPARALSGGNQQKLLLARALAGGGAPPRVLLAAQPTRGVDIGAIESIHRALLAARDRGCAILLISAELDELRALCDRIAVLYRGQILAELSNSPAAPASRERLGELLAGVRSSAALAAAAPPGLGGPA